MAEQLVPKVEGATPGEIERSRAAARQVFAAAGVTAVEAVAASVHRQALDEVLDSCGVHALMDGIVTLKEQGAYPSIVAAAEAELAWATSQPGMRQLTKREDELADFWNEAYWAALHACCQGWRSLPIDAESDIAGPEVDLRHDRDEAPPEVDSASGCTAEQLVEWVRCQLVAGALPPSRGMTTSRA